jgi:hypothetical protein
MPVVLSEYDSCTHSSANTAIEAKNLGKFSEPDVHRNALSFLPYREHAKAVAGDGHDHGHIRN